MIDLLLAVPELEQEPALVACAAECGIRVTRRCVDAVDLLAAAATDSSTAIVLSAGLPRLSRDALDRMAVGCRPVLGLAAGDAAAQSLRSLGVTSVVAAGSTPQATLRAVAAAIASVESDAGEEGFHHPSGAAEEKQSGSGRLVAVWGPQGSPGRTTVAIALAEAVSAAGLATGLIDADTYGPSIAMALGIVEDASGLVVACRHADLGSLTPVTLRAAARPVRPTWAVLGGVAGPTRWADLRAGALETVWDAAREAFDVTVVDVGFCIEQDADDGTAWSRRRNAAATSAITAADLVVAVADTTPLGAARLLDAWPSLLSLTGGREPIVVANRAGGARLTRQWTAAVRALGIGAAIHGLPDDAEAVARSWERAQAVGEGRRRSPLGRSVRELAASVVSG